jgi:hypothetical protein
MQPPPDKWAMIELRQRLDALERANEIRRARAELKRQIGAGERSAAQVILECPEEVRTWPVEELLASRRGWGKVRVRKFLAGIGIREIKPIGELTVRQRRLLATQLDGCGQLGSELGTPAASGGR